VRLGVKAALAGGELIDGDVEIEEGIVSRLGVSPAGSDGVAVPGFVDLHINGIAGIDFLTADPEAYRRAGEALARTGVVAYQPTFVSSEERAYEEPLRAADAARDDDAAVGLPLVLGVHLEGPFLSPEWPGAHDPEHLRVPDPALAERLLGSGRVTTMTLAPELPGALELIDELVARGITPSAGHTDAVAAQAHRAFDRGVHTVTHLYNAMRPSTARDPGIGFAALTRSDVVVQLIVDYHHLAPDTVRVVWQAAAGRFALVTDAVAAAAMGDGEYRLGSRPLWAEDGMVRGPEGQLGGSALTMIEAVRNLNELGVSVEEALTAASTVPARVAGRPDLGRIEVGAPADLVVLDDRLEVERVLVQGGTVVAR
jgi:N-acetylglucosamine-6-phosphate deacetylase